jgi:hypothetical protein
MNAYVNAFVLCDNVIFDAYLGKFSIIGISNTARVPQLPFWCPKFSCFASLSDMGGELTGTFRVLDPELCFVSEVSASPVLSHRADVAEFMAVFSKVPLHKPGRHTLQFLVNGEIAGSTRLDVQLPVTEPPGS